MYAGLILSLVWGGVQAVAQNTSLIDYDMVNQIQLSFSIRRVMNRRVSAFAFEPSWLADQIVLFYFPWLFAALLTRFRLTKYNWLEPVLCVASFFLLLLTYSRSGVIGLLISVILVMLTVGRGIIVSIWSWLWAPFVSPEIKGIWNRIVVLLLVVLLVAAAFFWLDSYNYFSTLWETGFNEGLVRYAIDIAAGPRLAYIEAGVSIFNLHPWFGVGLGGSSFYLFDHLPDWALVNPQEIAEQTSPGSKIIPNVRNLIIRLLAETGFLGLWLYIAFMLSILGSIRKMFLSRRKLMIYASVAGLTAWPAVILRQFTLSTLTSPVMWISLGMVVGYAHHVLDVPGATVTAEANATSAALDEKEYDE
jgi:O-antigen ligase